MILVERAIRRVSEFCAKPIATLLSVLFVLAWAAAGPFAHFSDAWQLVLNTGTSIITFVLLFILIAAQARDTGIIITHLKAQTLATEGVDDALVKLDQGEQCDVDAAQQAINEKLEGGGPRPREV